MYINPDKCVACGNCTYVCPMGAIYIDPTIKRATINRDECVECYACYNGLSQEHLNPDDGAHDAQDFPDAAAAVRSRTGRVPDGGVRARRAHLAARRAPRVL